MWRRIGVLGAMAVIIGAAIAGSRAEDTSAIGVQRGDAYRDAYLYTLAAGEYARALEAQPSNTVLMLRLCDVWLRRAQPDQAEAYADRAASAGANRADLAECRAGIAERRGRWSVAAEQWAVVAASRPDDRAARGRLMEARLEAHEWAPAAAQARDWLEADPSDGQAAFYLGALLALDDPRAAQTYLSAAGSAEAAALSAALADPPASGDRAYRAVSIGRLFLDCDRLALAWRAFAAATTDNPAYAEAFAYLGITYDRLGDGALAGAYLDRAVGLNPESASALYLRGVYLSRQARWAEARVDLDRASRLDPDSAPVAFALGRALAEQGDFAQADSYLASAVTRQPDNVEWQLALAELYIGRLANVAADGLAAARRAVELAPDSARAHDWLGWGLHLTGDDEQAAVQLRRAVALDPALAQARLHLGKFLIDIGRVDEGRTELSRAADLDPTGATGARARQWLGQP